MGSLCGSGKNKKEIKDIKHKVGDLPDYNNYNQISSSNIPLDKIREECLKRHNFHRGNHQVEDLKLSQQLNELAQKYAQKLADTNNLVLSNCKFNDEKMGENLFMSKGGKTLENMAVDYWYDEINDYNFENPSENKGNVGQFTQLIWKGSKELGVGYAKSINGDVYIVANYYPAGNYRGQELENVLAKI